MNAIAAKWISSFVLFAATLAVSIIPVMLLNYFTKRKQHRRQQYNIQQANTFHISSISSNQQQTSRAATAQLSADADNDSITGSGENVIRRTRSNSIGSITSISSRKLNKRSAAILQIFMFFGGGVLLATCFCHLIPEVKENYENYMHKDVHTSHDHLKNVPPFNVLSNEEASTEISTDQPDILDTTLASGLIDAYRRNTNLTNKPTASFLHGGHNHEDGDNDHDESSEEAAHVHKHGIPWVEIAICAGFFFMYLIEEIVHTFVHNHHHGHDQDQQTTYQTESIDDIRWDLPYQSSKTDSDTHLVKNQTNKSLPCYDNYAIDFNSEPTMAKETTTKRKSLDQGSSNERTSHPRSIAKQPELLPASVRFMQGLVTIVAFSAHSVFDGLAIGLQSTSKQIFTMLFAISMHKLVVAFAVGLEIFDQTKSVPMTSFHMSLFSIMSPIGIWIVIFTQSRTMIKEDESLFFILLNAAATGTIIYIVFFEILQKDRNGSNVNGLLLWLIMLSGFVLMVFVNVYFSG